MFVVLESRGLKPVRILILSSNASVRASLVVPTSAAALVALQIRTPCAGELVSRCGPSYDPQQGLRKPETTSYMLFLEAAELQR